MPGRRMPRAVDEFLLLLARAIQQFHTYPPTSQICQTAIDACQRALVALEDREQLVFRVMPREVIVDEVGGRQSARSSSMSSRAGSTPPRSRR